MDRIKDTADRILYECGLKRVLEKYGEVHIVGSYYIDAMAWNDLDVYVDNRTMTTEKLYALTSELLTTFNPSWYEAKHEIHDGNNVWFHGFEAMLFNELWNIDIWFFNEESIQTTEGYCAGIKQQLEQDPIKKKATIEIKRELIERGLYSFDKYTSMDVYKAVLEQSIYSIDEFISNYNRT